MQVPRRLSLKIFAHNPDTVGLAAFIPVFHRWIQRRRVEGLLIDVADYQHVFNGPGIMLIGHDGDYGYTLSDGQPGIQYTLKQPASDFDRSLRQALQRVQDAADKLEAETSLNGLRFSRGQVQLKLLDRLHYPNQPEQVAQVRQALQPLAESLLGGSVDIVSADGDRRDAMSFTLIYPAV
jgi:hypothetical protein